MLFCSSSVLKSVLLFKLTINWPSFLKEWNRLEMKMKNYNIPGNLRTTMNKITYVVIGAALGNNIKNVIAFMLIEHFFQCNI